MKKGTRFLVWGKTPSDARRMASDVLTYTVAVDGGGSAVEVARAIDAGEPIPAALVLECPDAHVGTRPAPGHGVTVIYPSGRKRTVHAT